MVAKEHGLKVHTGVCEFDCFEAAVAFYESDAYQAALAVLDGGADRDIRLFEGI
jgi:uncharacterized protein (DUF1330 family)